MYKLAQSGVIRSLDSAFIPNNAANTDYLTYLSWVAAGNTPEPADIPDPRAPIQAQIDAIEQATMVPRVTREFMLLIAEREAVRIAAEMTEAGTPVTAEQLLLDNIGYQRALLVEAQIQALREQLWTIS